MYAVLINTDKVIERFLPPSCRLLSVSVRVSAVCEFPTLKERDVGGCIPCGEAFIKNSVDVWLGGFI